jgi:hypothetical protein
VLIDPIHLALSRYLAYFNDNTHKFSVLNLHNIESTEINA